MSEFKPPVLQISPSNANEMYKSCNTWISGVAHNAILVAKILSWKKDQYLSCKANEDMFSPQSNSLAENHEI